MMMMMMMMMIVMMKITIRNTVELTHGVAWGVPVDVLVEVQQELGVVVSEIQVLTVLPVGQKGNKASRQRSGQTLWLRELNAT